MLLSFKVLSVIFGTVGPSFHASSVLLVIEPVTNISGAVCVCVGSVSMSFVVSPLAFIDITVCMD